MSDKRNVILSRFDGTKFHAGPKAKKDIETILEQDYGMERVAFDAGTGKLSKLLNMAKRYSSVAKLSREADLIIMQWPYSTHRSLTRGIRSPLIIVHDLDGLRLQDENQRLYEQKFMKQAKAIISHNPKMSRYLEEQGADPEKIISLNLFDYLVDGEVPQVRALHEPLLLAYSGNLDKSQFLHELTSGQMNYEINAYGVLEGDLHNPKIHYQGALKPDEVPARIEGDIGLVWDGSVDERDADEPNKNYTRYNNPHKLSCYLAANMPVIVWEQAACARFVKANKIGWTIRTLDDINHLDFSDYSLRQENARKIGEKVRSGYYTRKAMDALRRKGLISL